MITLQRLVCVFALSLIVPFCVCYGSLLLDDDIDDVLTSVNELERYYTGKEIKRFEEMFKSGKIILYFYSLENDNVLHYAALKGDLDWVKRIVDLGADVNATDRYKRTPLLFAVISGNLALVEYLAQQGADVNAQDADEKTALHYAAEIGSLELVKWLVEKGLDVNAKDNYVSKMSVLHYAVKSDSLELVQWLVQRGADVNATDSHGENALQYAVSYSSLEMIQWLVEQGLDVNVLDRHDCTLLFFACRRGSIEIAQWLVDQGLNINTENDFSETPLFNAAMSKSPKLVQWLIERGADVNAKDITKLSLFFYISSNYRTTTKEKQDLYLWLNDHGLELKKSGCETLLSAALSGDLELVKWLVEQGVDVRSENRENVNALHCSARSGNLDLVQWVINQGFDINAAAKNGDTALTIACKCDYLNDGIDNLKLVQLLVKHGANANPNWGNKLCPYWIELWNYQRNNDIRINYSLICYLMFNDKEVIIVVSLLFLTAIIALLYFILIKRAKKKEQIEKA